MLLPGQTVVVTHPEKCFYVVLAKEGEHHAEDSVGEGSGWSTNSVDLDLYKSTDILCPF
jgi:hypothetical protein